MTTPLRICRMPATNALRWMSQWTVVVVIVGAAVALPTAGQESRPAALAQKRTPTEVVRAFVAAARINDLKALATTYAPPVDKICGIMDSFLKSHAVLLREAEAKWGKGARAILDGPKYQLRMPSFDSVETLKETIDGEKAGVTARLKMKKQDPPVEVSFDLMRVGDAWCIAGVGGQPLFNPEGIESFEMEWSVAGEAALRTTDAIKAGHLKSPKDAVTLRDQQMKIITHERMTLRRIGAAPDSRPLSPPGKSGAAGDKPSDSRPEKR